MAPSKKRAAPTAASQRPAKKRKSAEASIAKMKQIADAEDDFSEDEMKQVEASEDAAYGAEDASTVDETEMQDHAIGAEEPLPVVAPGFRMWETASKLASKGEMTDISKYDEAKEEYSHFLKIKHNEAFKLMPLVVTQGPYKGNHVFMLLQQTGFFRFMDLPPEIRTMIYTYLFKGDSELWINTYKPVNQLRRPQLRRTRVEYIANPKGGSMAKGVKDTSLPDGLTLLRVSRHMLREAASVLYGNNHFHVHGLSDLKIFLDTIGTMRHYLRYLHIGKNGWWRSKARTAFHPLKDVAELRILSFDHGDVDVDTSVTGYWTSRYTTSPAGLVYQLSPLLASLKKLHAAKGNASAVLELIKIDWDKCGRCKEAASQFAVDDKCIGSAASVWTNNGCKVKCKDAAEHCKEVENTIRTKVAELLDIKLEKNKKGEQQKNKKKQGGREVVKLKRTQVIEATPGSSSSRTSAPNSPTIMATGINLAFESDYSD